MKCPQCGRRTPPNPLKVLGTTLESGAIWLLLSHVTPEPGFYANWLWALWWICAISTPVFALFFLFFAITWLTDPVGYKYAIERESHGHR